MINDRILVISDTHFPYNHPDVIAFLTALKNEIKPTRVIHIGDEVDWHSLNFHEISPDLMSPSDELQTSINRLQPIYKLFPKVDVIESNHGSLVYRRQKRHGIPRHVIKSYRDILEAPSGWSWHFDLTLKLPTGQHCYFHHGKSSDAIKVSQSMGMCYIQGHYHESFEIKYWGNPLGLFWSMIVGCLIDNKSLCFAYNKNNLKRPVIGTGAIINGYPKLFPMVLNEEGRWIKRLL